jgi:pyridoxal phosphate enzyme (YggS family)
MTLIKENIHKLQERMAQAAQRVGRDVDEISIVAVAKTVPLEKIKEAISCGVKIIGENRVQEARQKFTHIGSKVEWHMVGHLQTNKVKDALRIFSMIHSLDSLRLAREIEKRAEHPINCLIEINTSEEKTKFGITPESLLSFFASIKDLEKVNVIGLMTIGPGWATSDPEVSRPCFRLLHDLADRLTEEFNMPFPILSMGMTSDFEVAIEEGSTMVRVGTALFGPRGE